MKSSTVYGFKVENKEVGSWMCPFAKKEKNIKYIWMRYVWNEGDVMSSAIEKIMYKPLKKTKLHYHKQQYDFIPKLQLCWRYTSWGFIHCMWICKANHSIFLKSLYRGVWSFFFCLPLLSLLGFPWKVFLVAQGSPRPWMCVFNFW